MALFSQYPSLLFGERLADEWMRLETRTTLEITIEALVTFQQVASPQSQTESRKQVRITLSSLPNSQRISLLPDG
jgi:hypothetical protein